MGQQQREPEMPGRFETTELGGGRVSLEADVEISAAVAERIEELLNDEADAGQSDAGVREIGHASGPPAD